MLTDVDGPTAQRAAEQLGFERSTGDWHQLVGDPDIDLVDITTPIREWGAWNPGSELDRNRAQDGVGLRGAWNQGSTGR